MAWYERWHLRVLTPGILVCASVIGVWIWHGNILAMVLSSTGIVCTLIVFSIHKRTSSTPSVLWDERRSILAILWPWSLEVVAGCLMTSVPMGIDLSHSATRVLRAMHSHYNGKDGGEVRYIICRPLGEGPTRAGLLAARRTIRFLNGVRQASKIADHLATDVMVLESAMRAAYPHLPVERAGLDDIMMVTSGGVKSYDQVG
ncbi:MAG: hypothetical protein ACFFD6_05510 [Candidatus Thorarchaeota archaeon]